MKQHLVLVGLMGSGKSTVARLLHRRLGLPVYEVDALIEKRANRSIAEIFAQEGEDSFREIERQVVQDLVTWPTGIVSTGGGTFISAINRPTLLQSGLVFYLHGTPAELARRIQSAATRPLLRNRDKVEVLEELFAARHERYRQAQRTIETDCRPSLEVADEVAKIYEELADE